MVDMSYNETKQNLSLSINILREELKIPTWNVMVVM